MGSIVKIISTKIEDFVISTVKKRMGFPTEHYHFSPSGDDSPPLPDDKAFIVKKDGTGNYVILGNLMISQGAEAGEKILYARDEDGNLVNSLYLQKDGTISLTNENGSFEIDPDGNFSFNNGTDNAVRYSKLNTAFVNQDTATNGELGKILTSISAMVTAWQALGVTIPPYVQAPITTNITASKVEEIKIP